MSIWTHAKFYVTHGDGFRYVIETGHDGLAENITITYEEFDEKTKEYNKKPMDVFHVPYGDKANVFLKTVEKAQEFAKWSAQFDESF
jgi:hypothetical protein